MNLWSTAALVLLWSLVPCGLVCLRGDPVSRLVGLEAAGLIVTLVLLLLAEAFHRLPFYDVAVVAALLSFGGGLVFAQVLGRWL